MRPFRILFVKEAQNWPRSCGNDVHGYHLMKALAERGHAIGLATIVPPSDRALEGLTLEALHCLDGETSGMLPLSRLQRRFANYYGVEDRHGLALDRILCETPYDAVVLVARHLLPLLSAVRDAVRVWYPADDPTWHHLTRVKPFRPSTWRDLRLAGMNYFYERAFRPCLDRVWVVSPADRRAVRFFAGCPNVDLMPNGVDADEFRPNGEADLPASCVFWGRLDFDPNVDALEWFLSRVWPAVRKRTPAARFSVFGFNPRPRVQELARAEGVELLADLPDLRAEVTRRQVAVLPFVSGSGIKNKLLEAAALGLPIACSARALTGTKGEAPVRVCRSARDWSETLARLWSDPGSRRELGSAARRWVVAHHTWDAAARTAEAGLLASADAKRFDPQITQITKR